MPQPGDVVAEKYEIARTLGQGGMGVVVEARHKRLGTRVAIKFLIPDALTDAGVARFDREARASALVQSPYVVRVVDVDTTRDGLPFIVMEYLEGHDLGSEIKRRGTIPLAEAVDWLLEACIGLAAAHARGIVHRDIKPANLYLCEAPAGPVLKVMDFGVSKLLASQGETNLTATDMTVGTPSYMAPEQFLSAKTVDHRADVWALGIVAFRMLTGKLPFDGDSPTALAVAIATQPPLDLATLVPSLPPEAVAAIMGALEKDPAKRHQDVFAFGRALEPFGTKRVPFASAAARVVPALAVGSEPTKREGAADRPGRAAPVAIVVKVPSAPMVPDRVDVAPPALQRRSRAPLVLAALALGVAAAGAIVAFYMQADARTVTVAADRTTTTAGAAVSVTATASTPAAPEAPEASATTTSAEEAGVAPAPSTAPAFVVPDDLPDPWLRPAADGSQQR